MRSWGSDIVWNVTSAGTHPYIFLDNSNYFHEANNLLKYRYWIDMDKHYAKHTSLLYGWFDLIVYFDNCHDHHVYNDKCHIERWDIPRLIGVEETVEHCKNGILNLLHRLRCGQYQGG